MEFGQQTYVELTSIAQLLSCPECENLLLPPTSVCTNGHTYCKTCIEGKPDCPKCQRPFLQDTRNIPIETICQVVGNACPNRDQGCNFSMTTTLLDNHARKCLYRKQDCPYGKFYDVICEWSDPIKDLADHLLHSHKDAVTKRHSIMSTSLDKTIHFMIHKKEVFLCLKFKRDNVWYAVVQQVGLTCNNFKSVFGFRSSENSFDGITMIFPVLNMREDSEQILDKGLGLILDDEVVRNFIGKDGMNMMVGVEEVLR